MERNKPINIGDTIGIAAPSSPFDRNKFMKGIHTLEKIGFKTKYRKDIFDQNRYLAGSDKRRAEEFMGLFTDNEISAIMFARGGYGSQRIIPLLNAETLSKHPKPVIGFSDITALLSFLRQNAGIPTFYGPVITQLGKSGLGDASESLVRALTSAEPIGEITSTGSHTLKAGNAEGKIVGGCISLINSSIGTPYETNTKDSILFLEDIGEKVYVLDRMLTQLKNSGKLKDTKAIIFGSLLPPEEESYDIKPMIEDVLAEYSNPIILNFPAGHITDFITLPLGVTVQLEAEIDKQPRLIYLSKVFE